MHMARSVCVFLLYPYLHNITSYLVLRLTVLKIAFLLLETTQSTT